MAYDEYKLSNPYDDKYEEIEEKYEKKLEELREQLIDIEKNIDEIKNIAKNRYDIGILTLIEDCEIIIQNAKELIDE